ncbi:Alginate lyase precursor [Rosistilla ulvae]|uniref:Alginate lyase n=1 Tax=Rosistilla ulvae TaxID=1930277 RepID=A0A517LTH2_9BACT|nr:polysaccharide lyase family 7 protein [Rosistilla ulvae]QDS85907.1 Alginate lyase precursor [Rosistilla ulvae]
MPRLVVMFLALVIPVSLVDADPPAKLLDLSNWKLTLPIDADDSGGADEIISPDLKTFVDPRYFFINEADDGVVFRAHCGGATTKGSKFPRSELREMIERGREDADWSTAGQTLHTMTMRVAITKTPAKKKHVVCAQIHDAQDDLIMIRLEGTKLFIERNALDTVMLDRKYPLGTPFDLKIQAGGGRVKVWYEGELAMDWQVARAGCYFKAGCYTQSNPSKGDAEDSYGEVVIYRLQVREM